MNAVVPLPFAEFYRNESLRSLVSWLADTYIGAEQREAREALEKGVKAQDEALEREPQLFEMAAEGKGAAGAIPLVAFTSPRENITIRNVFRSIKSDQKLVWDVITAPLEMAYEGILRLLDQGVGRRGVAVVTSGYLDVGKDRPDQVRLEQLMGSGNLFLDWHLVVVGPVSDRLSEVLSTGWKGSVFAAEDYKELAALIRDFLPELSMAGALEK